eukprot:5854384-Pyramimonas_sp.AAC.1
MAQNYRELSRIPSAPTVFEHGLQEKMTKLVLSHQPLVPFPELILMRLQYWASRFPEVGQVGAPEAQLCFSRLKVVGQHIAPFVQLSLLRSSDANVFIAGDQIVHYLVCPALLGVMRANLPRLPPWWGAE